MLSRSVNPVEDDAGGSAALLEFHWNLVVGPALAEVSKVEKLESGVLHVGLSQSDWRGPLESLKAKILADLNARLEVRKRVEEIRFHVPGRPTHRRRPQARP